MLPEVKAGTEVLRLCADLCQRLGTDGFTRFVLLDYGLSPDQAAREAQRLCEIEAYRMLAMQGFPVAQQEAGEWLRESPPAPDSSLNSSTIIFGRWTNCCSRCSIASPSASSIARRRPSPSFPRYVTDNKKPQVVSNSPAVPCRTSVYG